MKILKIVVAGLLYVPAHAQQSYSLEEAVTASLQKNQLVKSAEVQVEYFTQVKKTGTDIGKLSATWMHGQYNSIYQDNNLTFVQTLPSPILLASQVHLGEEQVVGAKKNLQSIRNELVFQVKSTYYQLLYLRALDSLLQSQDSLFADFARASSFRYKTGESNLLEKATAETQWLEVRNQVRVNRADVQIAESHLQALLKNETAVVAGDLLKRRELPRELDSGAVSGNPQLSYLRQQVRISGATRKVERSRLLPDVSIGYFNQSLIGVQNINGQDQFFGTSKRFQGFEVGLSVPLWFGPQLARTRAAAFSEEASRQNAEHYQTTLRGAYDQALQEIEKNLASLDYYQGSALTNANLILTQARLAFSAGQIGYIEYLQSLKNAITIKSNFLHSLNQYNQSVVKIEFLIGKF